MDTAKDNAEKGLALLKQAALQVLYHACQHNEDRLKQGEIRKTLGFPKAQYGYNFNELVYHVLQCLTHEGYVEYEPGSRKHSGYRITEKGVDACKC